jgi:hypothetical protein
MLPRAFRNALPPREICSQGTFNGMALPGRGNGAVLVHVERMDSPPPKKKKITENMTAMGMY